MNAPDRHELENDALRESRGTTQMPSPDDPAPAWRLKLVLGLGLLGILFLISRRLAYYWFQTPLDTLVALTTGWLTYGLRVGSQLGQHWLGLAGGLVLVVLSFYSLHAVVRRQQRGRREGASSDSPAADSASATPPHGWHWKTSGIVLMLLMMTTAFTLCAGALLHQVGWLLRQDQWQEARFHSFDYVKGRFRDHLLLEHLLDFQRWHHELPERSEVYLPSQFLEKSRADQNRWMYAEHFGLIIVPSRQHGAPEPWIAVDGIPYQPSDAHKWPLMVSAYDHLTNGIIVGFADSSVTLMTREEWLETLEQWRPRFAENGVPWPRAFDVLGR